VKSELVKGDSLQELKKYDDNSVDLLCTDPPYGYGFMGRDWDKVLPDIGIFEECFRVLKPGSMAFVMSAPRSDVQYRMAEMLERVGFRIDYTPIYWTYATGFPKAMNIGKMIDKRDGNDREVIGVDVGSSPDFRDVGKKSKEAIGIDKLSYGQVQNAERKVNEITKGSSELEGSYAGFQPKPAVEVVIVAMKPIDKKGYLEQAEDNQKGVTWFDDCRIPFEESDTPKGGYGSMDIGIGKPGETQDYREDNERAEASPMGRFPANMLVSDEVLDDYSRYFSLDSWFQKNLESLPEPVQQTFPFMIVPKASRSEKDNGLELMEEKKSGAYVGRGGSQEDPNGMFKDRDTTSRNIHPTVKPLTLMSYLVTLGSRKDDMVLDPFMGSGTTPLACVSLERNYIGIDNEEEYYEIAKARVKKLEAPIKAWEKFI